MYYYASAIDIDAATIKTRATIETNAKVGGKKDVLTGATSYIIAGLELGKKYHITVKRS